MAKFNWMRWLKQIFSRSHRPRSRPATRGRRVFLRIEGLEDRSTPALIGLDASDLGVSVTAANDNGGEVAMRSDGSGFVVAYTAADADGTGVFAQLYNSNWQPTGSPIAVNTTTLNNQQNPSIAMDGAGNFVVAWEGFGQDGDTVAQGNIYARRFNANGAAVDGAEFLVNTVTTSDQREPDVAVNASGQFVIAFRSSTDGLGTGDIVAQSYTSVTGTLTTVGANATVNDTSYVGSQAFPAVAIDGSGNYVVAYQSTGQDDGLGTSGSDGIYARRMFQNGAPNGAEFRVNTVTAGDQALPDVAMDGGGNFDVVWSSPGVDGSGTAVMMQQYDRFGSPLGGNTQVNTGLTANDQFNPQIVFAGGTYAVTWTSREAGNNNGDIYFKLYDTSGAVTQPDTSVRTAGDGTAQDNSHPGLDDSGNLVVLFDTSNATSDTYLRRFAQPPTVSFAAATSSGAESSSASIGLTRSGLPAALAAFATSVQVTRTGGTAAFQADFSTNFPQTVNFAAGGSNTQNLSIVVVNDTAVEPDETIDLALGSVTNGAAGGQTTHVYTILNNDFPTVTSSTANLAANAATLTINGTGFSTTAANNTVSFDNGAVGAVTSATATSLTVTFSTKPATAGTLSAVVATNGQSSGAPVQVATVTPRVTTSSANIPTNAATVTINGFGFDPTAANNTVAFNLGAAGTVTAATTTSLTVTFSTKPSAGSLTAVVTTNGKSSGTATQVATTVNLAVTPKTVALAVNAPQIVITGSGFSTTAANNTVTFDNGAAGTVTAATSTSLTVTFTTPPSDLGALNATVAVAGLGSTGPTQVATIVSAPAVTASTGALPINSATVTINGTGFSTTPANNTVVFNNAAGTVTGATATSLTVTFSTKPTTVGNLTAVVTSNGGSSGTAVQVATVVPVVTSSTANLPANATSIVINGFGFSPAPNIASGNILVSQTTSTGTAGYEYTPTGTLVRTFNNLGGRDVVVDSNGNIEYYNGTFTPTLTGFNTSTGAVVSNFTLAGWSTVNNLTYGGLAAYKNYVFATDMNTASPGGPAGFIRFDVNTGNAVRVTASETIDLNIGKDGKLYTLANGNAYNAGGTLVSVYDPDTLAFIRSFNLSSEVRAIAVDASGCIYAAQRDLTSRVVKFDENGVELAAFNSPIGGHADIDLRSDGKLLIASHGGQLLVTDTAFSFQTFFNTQTSNLESFAGWVEAPLGVANPTVTFNNGAVGTVSAVTPTSLTVDLTTPPQFAGPLTAVVTAGGVSSGAAVQVASVAPAVTASTASLPANASSITIAGTGFDPTPSNNTVVFNNGATGAVTAATSTSLTVTFTTKPTSAGGLTAVVSTNGVSSGAATQVATVMPVATSSTANLAANSATVTINGFGFSPTAANNSVTFNNGAVGTVTAATATSLTVTFSTKPAGVGSLTAVVTSNSQSSGSAVQVATVTPAVTSSAAGLAADAATLTINGFGFDPTPSNNTVVFNDGAVGAVTAATATSLTVTFSTKPTSAGSLTAVVTTNGVGSGAAVQVATVTPVVTVGAGKLVAGQVIAQSGFNDAGGINGNATPNSPFGLGTVNGQGAGESGWAGPWAGDATLTTVENAVVFGGDQALQIKPTYAASRTLSTVQNGVFSTEQYVRFTEGARFVAYTELNSQGESPSYQGAVWQAFPDHKFYVVDGNRDGAIIAPQEDTGFTWAPGVWYKISTVVDTAAGTWSFYVNDVKYNAPDPLGFRGNTFSLDKVRYLSEGSGDVFLDEVTVANPTTLTINGSGFDPASTNNSVAFNLGAAGVVTSASPTSLTVAFSTPPIAGSLTAVVTSNGQSSGAPVQVASVTPTVTSSTANLAADATVVTINGTGFDPTAANNTVIFNNKAAGTVTAATSTSLTVTFSAKPTSAGNLTAVVTTNGQSSGAAAQVATVIPVITSSTASLAGNATTVTISGFGFSAAAANNTVIFNNGATGTVTAATATSLTVTGVSGLVASPLTAAVTTNGVSNGSAVQVATVTPVVTATTANLPANATTLIINGAGFDPTASNNAVVLSGGATGTVTAATKTQLTVNISGQTPGSLTAVVTSNSQSSGSPVQVATVVNFGITASTTALAINAPQIVIKGSGFSTTPSDNTVSFSSGAVGAVTAATATQLTVTFTTPPGVTGALNATVNVVGTGSTGPTQVATIVAAPTVTATTTSRAISAGTVTITGTGFDTSSPGSNTVVFNNGAAGTVTAATATSLTVTFSTKPTAAGNLTAVVTSFGGSSGAPVQVARIVAAPAVTQTTTPVVDSTPTVVITGTGFDVSAPGNNTVAFNNGAAGAVTSATATSLTVTFTTPPLTGDLTAVVTSFGGDSGAPVTVANVQPSPVITAAPGNRVPIDSKTVTITGTNFQVGYSPTVTLDDGAAGTASYPDASTIVVTFTTPPTEAGPLTAVVHLLGGQSAPAVVASLAPVVTSATAPILPTAPTVTIDGFGFSSVNANNTVQFNLGATGHVTSASRTRLVVTFDTLPTTGNLTAVVISNGVDSGSAVQVARVANLAITPSTSDLAKNAPQVVINGAGFSTTPGDNTVTFNNGAVGTVTAATSTRLTVALTTPPSTTGPLNATVGVAGFASTGPTQVANIVNAPAVTSSTTSLPINANTITIAGTGFSTTPSDNTVVFNNGATGAVTAATVTSLTVTFSTKPAAVGNLTAVVTSNGGSSGAAVQVATVAPVVTFKTGAVAADVTTVTIDGLGFSPTAANNVVTFNNGATGTVTAATATQLTVTGVSGLVGGPLTATVTTAGVSSGSAVQFAAVSPTVAAATGNLAASATTLTISGAGFDPTAANNTVTLSGGATGAVTGATRTQLTVSVSGLSLGSLTAVVTTNGQSSGSPVQVATVVAGPAVTANTASQYRSSPTVTINGSGFSTTPGNNTVAFNLGAVGTVTAATATSLTVTFTTKPTGPGALTAVVTTFGGSSSPPVQVATVLPTTANQAFVDNAYRQLLGRPSDSFASSWVAQLDGGTPPPNIIIGIEGSAEYLSRVIDGLYRRYLGRPADAGAQGWVKLLQTGTRIETVAASLIASPEFSAKHPSNADFVNALYTLILGRTGTTAEVNAWVTAVTNGAPRASVAAAFLASTEYRQNLVKSYYVTYLGRPAAAGEVSAWVGSLNAGSPDQLVLAGIFGSQEGRAKWSV